MIEKVILRFATEGHMHIRLSEIDPPAGRLGLAFHDDTVFACIK
jgi:hypothetical protein